jgi:hypothetical protein
MEGVMRIGPFHFFPEEDKAMTKLHEILAVQGNINGQATKTRTGLMDTFTKKRHLFESKIKTFTPNSEEGGLTTVEEQQDIQSTIIDEIKWLKVHLVKQIDIGYRVDLGNRVAVADIIDEDGVVLLKNVPTTTLLWMEKRAQDWKDLIESIPTLDPAKGFAPDKEAGNGIYRAREVTKIRTKKTKEVITLAKATDKFAEQAQLIDTDKPIGTIVEQERSALITPAMKAILLDNAEKSFRAITRARSKANDYEFDVTNTKIGEALFDYVFKPLLVA